ncbi:DNA repair protein RadA, partial [candidate division GN15 bacterium]|nr:DNA repair protein RadA [candidate division GN15 bacterium]
SVLIGGEPGIGKSTLMLQAAEGYSSQGLPVLYVTGEESLPQIKLRADRLGAGGERIELLNATSLEEIQAAIESGAWSVAIIDSVQTTASEMLDSPPGTVAQVRESAKQLISLARGRDMALLLVGHVTKEGMVAGPKVLEHMVDTVMYFEGDATHLYRILRCTKNRFGSIAEIGVFEMTPSGLGQVSNPSSVFLSEHQGRPQAGSVVTSLCEGTRPILIEVQALATSASYGNPQRVAGGIDNKRLALLLAILEKRCEYPMGANDVFVSVAGGLRVSEPAVDLPLVVAIASSVTNRVIDPQTLVVGEVGLSGEVRTVTQVDRRIAEAAKLGFTRMVLPQSNLNKVVERPIELIGVSSLQQALDVVLG